jgi:hypothetical protein
LIAPRALRRGLGAARPILVVGMAPSRAGHDIPSGRGGPTLGRLADYAGVSQAELLARIDFVNLLEEWPGAAPGGSEKWDLAADLTWAQLGQRMELLYADLVERPRYRVIGLGGFVREAISRYSALGKTDWFVPARGPGNALVSFSPHPAGTNMWWNDPEHRELGEAFWTQVASDAARRLNFPRKAVPLGARSRWMVDLLTRFRGQYPDDCIDWVWAEPPGRPQVYHRGMSMPAAHAALELNGEMRPSKEHQALHSCDRGIDCVNPGHLRWGTELENRMDQVNRGRGSIGLIGINQAQEITDGFARWVGEQAERYGASRAAIVGIVAGRSWDQSKWETTGDDGAPTP